MKRWMITRGMALFLAGGVLGVIGCPCLNGADGGIDRVSCEWMRQMAGTWRLVSFNIQDANGQTTYPFGEDAQGRLIYEANGRMAVQLMDPSRPDFVSPDPIAATEAEMRAAFDGYTAYYGTYSVDPEAKTIVHHVETSLIPNWVGTDQQREFEYDGKLLTLKGSLLLGGVQGTVRLVWERLP
ncbi:MAG: hypothetical protein QG656_2468 [Candidatus Hydrogenedentes bacterium]|nr:hypothetical protein [Candidatus Hydrogenedentota bacterium]